MRKTVPLLCTVSIFVLNACAVEPHHPDMNSITFERPPACPMNYFKDGSIRPDCDFWTRKSVDDVIDVTIIVPGK